MADIRRPEVILDHPDVARLINFGQQADLLCGAVLQLAPDAEDPEATVAQFRDHMYAGSYLTLSQFASDSDPEAMAGLRAVAAGTPTETYFRSRSQMLRFFNGPELMGTGLTDIPEWRQDSTAPTQLKITGAVGRKP